MLFILLVWFRLYCDVSRWLCVSSYLSPYIQCEFSETSFTLLFCFLSRWFNSHRFFNIPFCSYLNKSTLQLSYPIFTPSSNKFCSILILAVSNVIIGSLIPVSPCSDFFTIISHLTLAFQFGLPKPNSLVFFNIFVFVYLPIPFTLAL